MSSGDQIEDEPVLSAHLTIPPTHLRLLRLEHAEEPTADFLSTKLPNRAGINHLDDPVLQ